MEIVILQKPSIFLLLSISLSKGSQPTPQPTLQPTPQQPSQPSGRMQFVVNDPELPRPLQDPDIINSMNKWIGDPEPEAKPHQRSALTQAPYGDPLTCEELHSPKPEFEEDLPEDPTMTDENNFQGDIRAKDTDELLWMMGVVPLAGGDREGDARSGVLTGAAYRSATVNYRRRWPNNTIPYLISREYSDPERKKIGRAMTTIHKYTCIRFKPMVPIRDKSWIQIKKGKGCWSFIGMSTGEQAVSIAQKCMQHGTILHELMHAIGFFHQQMRHDRDNYVTIDLSHVKRKSWVNFGKNSEINSTNLDLPYDYSSVMHYKRNSFGRGSIESIPPNVPFGQRKGLSKMDVIGIQRLYGCKEPDFTDMDDLGKLGGQRCRDIDRKRFCKDQIRDLTCENLRVSERCKKSCGLCLGGGPCKARKRCLREKGSCIPTSIRCAGKVIYKGCKKGRATGCQCCVPASEKISNELMSPHTSLKPCAAALTSCGTLKQGICRPMRCHQGEFPSPVATCEGINCKCCKPKTELCSSPDQPCGPHNRGRCRSKCLYWERAENCKACHCPGRHCQCCYTITYSTQDVIQYNDPVPTAAIANDDPAPAKPMYLHEVHIPCTAPNTVCGALDLGICRPHECLPGEFSSPVPNCEGQNCKCCKPNTMRINIPKPMPINIPKPMRINIPKPMRINIPKPMTIHIPKPMPINIPKPT